MGLVEWLEELGGGSVLITLVLSMTPVLELRAAIPVGVSLGLSHLSAMTISVIGNILPSPFIIIFIRKIFAWMRKHMPKLEGFVAKLEKRAAEKEETVRRWEFWGLVLLVAVPLPGTGAWTGSLVAALMHLRFKKAFPAVVLGVVIAAVVVTGITFGFTEILG